MAPFIVTSVTSDQGGPKVYRGSLMPRHGEWPNDEGHSANKEYIGETISTVMC